MPKTLEPLICPSCRCQLTPPQASATGMNCPRCLTWLEFDPLCQGTCLSCHKMREVSPSPCIESSNENGEEPIVLGFPGSQESSPRWESVFGKFFSKP